MGGGETGRGCAILKKFFKKPCVIDVGLPAEHVEAVSGRMLEKEFVEVAGAEMLLMLSTPLRRPLIGKNIRRVAWTPDFGRCWNSNSNENDIIAVKPVKRRKACM